MWDWLTTDLRTFSLSKVCFTYSIITVNRRIQPPSNRPPSNRPYPWGGLKQNDPRGYISEITVFTVNVLLLLLSQAEWQTKATFGDIEIFEDLFATWYKNNFHAILKQNERYLRKRFIFGRLSTTKIHATCVCILDNKRWFQFCSITYQSYHLHLPQTISSRYVNSTFTN